MSIRCQESQAIAMTDQSFKDLLILLKRGDVESILIGGLAGMTGGGTYEVLFPETELVEIFDTEVRCVTLECLIQLKRAAGRPKDIEALSELVALLEERDRPQE